MIRHGGNRRGGAHSRAPRSPVREWGHHLKLKVGAVPLLVLAMAVLWLAWSVHQGQAAVVAEQARQEDLLEKHRELSRQRDILQARERIEKEAARQGLYPPGKGQIQRP
ncbi:hypothetical protein [Desulfurivibrio dismutans]|uniref:hypothetical protein n=1 Tax=Desulfurivibrio dismutans TaxID=1398908 RepID=UPI0023DC3F82|nr:hypothetical protein [Desulfurivibrio alkaliphilus]MDF1613423.1 hypothetical protein [Desulfurivibrio alkaliphilus]